MSVHGRNYSVSVHGNPALITSLTFSIAYLIHLLLASSYSCQVNPSFWSYSHNF